MKIKNLMSAVAFGGLILTCASVQSAAARELRPGLEIAEGMTFTIDKTQHESPRNRNPQFITNPSSTDQYKFVKRLISGTYEGEDLGSDSAGRRLGNRLYWLAEVVEVSTGKAKAVAVPLEFLR